MGKRIISILLMMCLCISVLAGCGASGGASAPSEAAADNSTAQDGSQKILGIIGDATLSSEQADVEALCESCGVDFWGYADYTWLASDEEKAAEDAISLIADYGCTTIIFAVKGTEQIADQFSLQHPETEIFIADVARSTDATADDMPSDTPEKADIDWTEVSYTETDSDGYTYEITFKLSPWILQSNTDIVNSAWSEVGGSNTIPGFNDWGLKQESSGGYFRQGISEGGTTNYFAHHMTDIYYCVGTAQITNITEGWSISVSNPRSLYFYLRWVSNFDRATYAGVYSIGRVFFSNSTEDESDGLGHSAKMTSDQWGPVSFVIMAPENFAPNFPDGEHAEDMLNGYFYYIENGERSEEIHLGMFGKDGTYTPPISAE